MMIPQNKNVRQLVLHLYYVDTAEGSEIYCYNTDGIRNLIVSQASCRMDVTRLELRASVKRGGSLRDSSVRKSIVPQGFHKLTVAFSSISPSQYGCFDVGTLF